jgi:beta-galactosidase
VTASLPAEVALLRSYDTLWAFEAQPTTDELSYDDQIGRYYRALWHRNVPVDLITEDRPWESYKLLIAPCLFVLCEDVADRLRTWVEEGGTLVVTFRSGVKDAYNKVVNLPLPGLLADLAGVRVADYTALLPSGSGIPSGGPETLELTVAGTTHRVSADIWMDELELRGAEALGWYRDGPFAGTPAVSLHRVGAGKVFYVGTSLEDTGQNLLIGTVLAESAVAPGVESPDNVEVVRRVLEGRNHWFILNHSATPQEITLPTRGIDLLTGKTTSGPVMVNGRDALVVRSQPDL